MGEALAALRSSLGSDALILETKNHPQDRGGGVEITALAENPAGERRDDAERETAARPQALPVDELRQELAALKSMLGWLAPGLNHQDGIVKALMTHGLAPEMIAKLSDAMKRSAGGDDRERWYRAISEWVPSGGQIRSERDRLALIGPAGAGKTATLIKLTVFETQRRACRVGWINTDDRHLAAGEPLAIYAGILGVRYENAGNKKELKQALEHLSDCDLILVDTAGVNPRDEESVQNLAKFFHGVPELRRALLLSAATHGRDMAEWVTLYGKVGLNALLFTKLDECRYFGPLINTALSSGVPVSYITLGQNFTGDLEIAKPEVFASLLLTGVDLHD
jgi:flagellar biosynthesis protein FlhF